MIYVTGDTHGDRERFSEKYIAGERNWTKDDILIIAGDFGYLFKDDDKEREFLNSLEEKPYTVCFCDGNHENFTAIYKYPVEEWMGGKIRKIRKNVYHLTRGQVYEIDGKRIFTMGGAYSVDAATKGSLGLHWKEEIPTEDEREEARRNLKRVNYEVDYIVTHTTTRKMMGWMGRYHCDYHETELLDLFDWIEQDVKFKKWFFGHWHLDREMGDKFRAVLFDVVLLE